MLLGMSWEKLRCQRCPLHLWGAEGHSYQGNLWEKAPKVTGSPAQSCCPHPIRCPCQEMVNTESGAWMWILPSGWVQHNALPTNPAHLNPSWTPAPPTSFLEVKSYFSEMFARAESLLPRRLGLVKQKPLQACAWRFPV